MAASVNWIFQWTTKTFFKSSQQRCSVKRGVPRNFAKFTGKQLCQSLFFNKVAGCTSGRLLLVFMIVLFLVACGSSQSDKDFLILKNKITDNQLRHTKYYISLLDIFKLTSGTPIQLQLISHWCLYCQS